MRQFTIESVNIDEAKGIITFDCRDYEQEMFNEFRQDANYLPYYYKVTYNCLAQEEANLLIGLIKLLAPESKSLTEGANNIASLGIHENKALDVYWSKKLGNWYFKFWESRA